MSLNSVVLNILVIFSLCLHVRTIYNVHCLKAVNGVGMTNFFLLYRTSTAVRVEQLGVKAFYVVHSREQLTLP